MPKIKKRPHLYIVAGPNGAGKTTFAKEFLPHFANCREFINTDLVATGLSPFDPRTVAMEAAKLVLKKIKSLSSQGKSFALETTLSGRTYKKFLTNLRRQGYQLHMFFLWIPSVDIAIQRVKDRVRRGGHDVLEPDIRRRFQRGISNFFLEYNTLLDSWMLFDNSDQIPRLIACQDEKDLEINDQVMYNMIKEKALKAKQ